MRTKLAVAYLATPLADGSSSVEFWVDDDHSFSVKAGVAKVGPYASVSRVDFYARPDPGSDPQLLAVVPCIPANSSIGLNSNPGRIDFSLLVRDLLGGPNPKFESAIQWSDEDPEDLIFAMPNRILGIAVAGSAPIGPVAGFDENNIWNRYCDNLLQIRSIKYARTVNAGAAPSSFETLSQTNFNSDHISFAIRLVNTGGTTPLPIFCPFRGYTIVPKLEDECGYSAFLFGGPFDLQISPANEQDSPYHVTQFPSLAWLTDPPSPLPEPAVWHFETGEFPQDLIAQFYNSRVRQPYVGGLRILEASQPLSLLPSLDWAAPAADTDNSWRIVRTTRIASDQTTLSLLAERLVSGGNLIPLNGSPTPATVTASFNAFRTQNAKPLQCDAQLQLWNSFALRLDEAPPANSAAIVRRMSFILALNSLDIQFVRLGSLDLAFGGVIPQESILDSDSPQFTIDFEQPRFKDDTVWIPRLSLSGSLPVVMYAPGGQDEPPSQNEFRITAGLGDTANDAAFARSSPIVIDAQLVTAGQPVSADVVGYKLAFSELTLRYPQQQQLVLTLSALPTQSGNGTPIPPPRALVLDREPFLVAFVSLGTTVNSDDTDSALVGTWCNLYPEGAGWRLRAGAGGFNLYLPPQAVGEAMVKGFSAQDPNAPQPDSTADYRFSPLLCSRLLANYFARNAVEPGWNTRRILGYAGQQLPGALVDANNGGIQFELLYGMTASVTQPSLRLSEIFARLGNFPGPLPSLDAADPEFTSDQKSTYNQAGGAWSDLYTQLLSRPAVLELWDDHQGPDLLLDTGIEYTLRKEVFYDGDGQNLSGGIGYVVESPNIRTELLASPQSTAARLVSPRFTALGGFGTQRAEFAGGKIIVDSRTSLGRLESMTITLVGRVGNLYNRALHVTTYDRTVLPSDQFYGEQGLMPGRPLLRKTSEYVLITEPLRAYPESGAADPKLAGFVKASQFKSIKIFVDSNWGGDVGTIGWQVPLWKPGAQPAPVYPRPHVALLVGVDPATGIDTVSGELSDPQKLCFYTDTQTKTGTDTDTWPVVSEIDWIDQPPNTDPGAEYQDPSVEPGFGRFTYHFVESPAQVNLVAERANTAVGATLRNVSIMRGTRAAAGGATAAQTVRRLNDWWAAARAHLDQAANTPGQTANTLKNSVDEVRKTYLNALAKDLPDPKDAAGSVCAALQSRLSSALNRLNAAKQSTIQTLLQEFPGQLLAKLNAITEQDTQEFLVAANTVIDTMTRDGQDALKPFTVDVDHANTVIDLYVAQLNTFSTALTDLSEKLTADAGQATQACQDALAKVFSGSQLRTEVDAAAGAVDAVTNLMLGGRGTSLVAVIDGGVDVAMLQLQSAFKQQQLPAQVKTLEDALQAKLTTLQQVITNAINACGDAQTALTALGSQNLQTVMTNLGQSLKNELSAGTLTTVAAIQAAYTNYITTTVGNGAAWADAQIQQQETWIQNNAASLCQALSLDLTHLITQLRDFAKTEASQLLQNVASDTAQFTGALQALGNQVESQLQQVIQGLTQEGQAVITGATGAALQVIRAFGEPPHVPTLEFRAGDLPSLLAAQLPDFKLPTMAYGFDGLMPTVGMTKAIATARQFADGLGNLSQLSVNLSTSALLDRLLPDPLENFDLRAILPHFAGIDLSTLFAGVRMPSVADNTLRITHHIDPQHKRASLDADILVPLADDTSILDLGPVNLRLSGAQLTAQVHCEIAVGQQVTQTSSGQITGNWDLLICGVSIVSFSQTTLSFDASGHLHFSIVASNVHLTAILQFLADIVNSFTFGDSGFSLHMTPSPLSVQCILDLPLPDMASGAFGIMNLDFGALFEVGMDGTDFYLGVGANLGRQTAPFVLTVFVLGGAGWMEAYLRYKGGRATGEITIGMAASAAIEIALGPISGSVSIQFGVFVEFSIGTGGGLQLGIMILVVGRVSLCGIIDANITLLLEAEYSRGGGLVGRGYVSVTIKICWCFTFSVHAGVEYGFGNAAKSQPAVQAPAPEPAMVVPVGSPGPAMAAAPASSPFTDYKQAASDYIDMLA